MNSVLLSFSYISCFLSLVFFFIILSQNKFYLYSKILILTSIVFCFLAIGAWTLFQGQIPLLKYAYVSVYPAPLYFLPGLILFLYIKSVVNKHKGFSKWELLHFIPTVLNIILLLPYFMLPTEAKQETLAAFLTNHGKLPEVNVFFFSKYIDVFSKITIWFIYLILTIRTLIKFRKNNSKWITEHKAIWQWINRITAINGISFLLYIVIFSLVYDSYSLSIALVGPPLFFILTTIIVLMFNPKILYGLKKQQFTDNINKEQYSKTLELSPLKIEEYKIKIEKLVDEKEIFLIKNYALKDMSDALDIPLHHLSFVINKEFGGNYKFYINRSRINYIIKNRYCEEWAHFSLEGIGDAAGFSSRNTFFKVFKIVTGETPAQYFKQTKIDKI